MDTFLLRSLLQKGNTIRRDGENVLLFLLVVINIAAFVSQEVYQRHSITEFQKFAF